jgi:hypothetical protein
VTVYETVVHYLNLPKKYLKWFYCLCFAFLLSLWTTDLFIKGAYLQSFGYYPEAGMIHGAYLLMVCFLMVKIFIDLYRVLKLEQDLIKKTQLKFFFISIIIFCFSAIDYFLNYPVITEKLNVQIYPFGVFFISFSMLVFILSHFITLNLTLENRVALKTIQLKNSITALEETARSKKDFIANVTYDRKWPLA